ncbi:MAG: YraN family protein [Candidatus Jorgensenbacteria bacterium]|nr:YraN family protein [Candidatus Jorgensenbacteria bacterium]
MTQKSELGRIGEDTAVEFLKNKKYKIIERNARESWGELDIIALAPDKTLVFVEVKTMSDGGMNGLKPEDQMSFAKIEKFKKAAMLYAGYNQKLINDKRGWRLDVVTLVKKGEGPACAGRFEVRHYENI